MAGIKQREHRQEAPTPRAVTRDKVLTRVFAPSRSRIKGRAPATVVPPVARRRGKFFRRPRYRRKLRSGPGDFRKGPRPPALNTEAFTAMPLSATKAQAAAGYRGAPPRPRHRAGKAKEGGTTERTARGIPNDS